MNSMKRIATWAVLVLSIIGILVCLAGIIASWSLNESVTEGILGMLSGVQTGLSSVENSLTLAVDGVQSVTTALQKVREAASGLGDNIEENTPILDTITNVLNEEVVPRINELREIIQPIRDVVVTVNGTLEAINALPGIEVPTLTDQLEALDARIQEVSQAIEQMLATTADIKAGIVENFLDPFIAGIDQVINTLTTLAQNLAGYLQQVNDLQVVVGNLQAQVPGTIDAISIILSIILVWAILAQTSLILAARFYLKTGIMVWENLPREQALTETALEP
jgi:hypothetical protein